MNEIFNCQECQKWGVGCKEENFLPYNPRGVLDINFIQLKTYLGTKPKVDGPVRFRNTET